MLDDFTNISPQFRPGTQLVNVALGEQRIEELIINLREGRQIDPRDLIALMEIARLNHEVAARLQIE